MGHYNSFYGNQLPQVQLQYELSSAPLQLVGHVTTS